MDDAKQKKIEERYATKLNEWRKSFNTHVRKLAKVLNGNYKIMSSDDAIYFVNTYKKSTCIVLYIKNVIGDNALKESETPQVKVSEQEKNALYYIIYDLVQFDKIIKAIKRTKIQQSIIDNENFQKILEWSKDSRKLYHIFYDLYNKILKKNDEDENNGVNNDNVENKNDNEQTQKNNNKILLRCKEELQNILKIDLQKIVYDMHNEIGRKHYTDLFDRREFDPYEQRYDVRHLIDSDNDQTIINIEHFYKNKIEKLHSELNYVYDENIKELLRKLQKTQLLIENVLNIINKNIGE